ncbi:MAG: hypothetical protein EBZ69_06840 [Alphaproteobacteria bacterium]|nr:hypothetical protein [Alphaproteobacteria bacterium]NDC56510.1 hypothetical protein [Alphaproteobacteria bacterium]NDG04856.1 hypothetical protein [Alphaproteobacteria bacterium]
MTPLSVYIGFDKREPEAYDVTAFSIQRHASAPVDIFPLKIDRLRAQGLYTRPTSTRDGRLWDDFSDAPMSTEFAITRFLVPHLATTPWAVFCDCDFLWRHDIFKLINDVDDSKALWCVQHDYRPAEATKMDNQAQTQYSRKNWSSMMVWNVPHPANKKLTLEMVNTLPGRDLHRFCWLADGDIGNVSPTWNWLEGHSDPAINPNVIHYTRGGPWFDNWQHVAFAQEWLDERAMMKKQGYRAAS